MVARVCADPLDYWRGLASLWGGPFPLVNVEHDMQVSDALVDDLLACPRPLCTHAYQMHIPTTHYAHSTRWHAEGGGWIGVGDKCAAWSGIGLCKITPELMSRPLERQPWMGVEISVNEATGGDWHIHWPGVEHHHR